MKKKTAVNIVPPKEKKEKKIVKTEQKEKPPLSKKMEELIDEIARLSLEENVTYAEITTRLSKVRTRHIRERDGEKQRPTETDDEIEFRAKVEKFFSNVEFRPEDFENSLANRYSFDFANFHIEAACAIYKLMKEEMPLNRNNIFLKARPWLEFNIDAKPVARGRETNLAYVFAYYRDLVEKISPVEMREEDGSAEFLNQYDYKEDEEAKILLIYLIQNQ